MTSRDEAKLSMYRAVSQHCSANATIVNTNLAFKASNISMDAKIATLLTTETSVQKQTKGVAQDKGTLRATVVQSAFDTASQVYAYANKTKNDTLKQIVNYSITDLERIKDDLLIPTCNNIKKAANDNLAALADYGVTAATLTAFQTDMDNYSISVAKPRLAKTQKTTDNKNVKTTMKEIDNILKEEMDKTVVSFRKTNPDFVTKYKEVRKIVDPATLKKADKTKTDAPK